MKIAYGVCSWGLGHATRSIPIIKKLVEEDNDVTIFSTSRALSLLKRELGGDVKYIDLLDYPLPYPENPHMLLPKFFILIPKFIRALHREHWSFIKYLERDKYKKIVSDCRYGIYERGLPTIFITHQLRLLNPFRLRFLESGTEIFNRWFFKRYWSVIVPDFEYDGLAGDLCHGLRYIDEKKMNYVGPISDFKKIECEENIDYYFSISGPEPQRSVFERSILSFLSELSEKNGNIVVTLGKSEIPLQYIENTKKENIKIISFVEKEEREKLISSSKLIIARSGYSTVMDLCIAQKKALFIPTPQQTEQEYLARYLKSKGYCHSVSQMNLNLKRDLSEAMRYKGIKRETNVEKSVERAIDLIYNASRSVYP